MTLEDFEKELAQQREIEGKDREKRSDTKHRHHHPRQHHHHRRDQSRSRSQERERDSRYDQDRHRSKRSRRSGGANAEPRRHHRRRRGSDEESGERSSDDCDDASAAKADQDAPFPKPLRRDTWMEAPSALDVDYKQPLRRPTSPPKFNAMEANHELKLHEKELNHHLRDIKDGKQIEDLEDLPAKHEVDYVFGDAGSNWRMTKLKAVYHQAKASGRKVDDVAMERYDTLREFDDAREEQTELDRREAYGEGYIGKERPSSELFQERKLDAGIHRHRSAESNLVENMVEGMSVPTTEPPPARTVDQSTLNKLKSQMLQARMKKDPKAIEYERAYDDARGSHNAQGPEVITISAMDHRMLSGAPRNEVKAVGGRRAQERGQVEENEDMSIADMVREERRTRDQPGGEGQRFADRIAKDVKFDNDLEYMDENATKLAKRVHKSEINLRNTAITDYQKLNKILDNCPLCHHEDTGQPPIAPIISLATRTYLTLPTEPELSSHGAVIVPIQHRTNLLECDDDEWEEVRNFMKSLTRLYHDQGRDVIFYENAAFPHRRPHAALQVVALPYSLGETAPAFFKEAFLTAEDEWSQHKKIIDTLSRSKQQGLGKSAFRRSLAKEMPYFHVWFELDGGIGHIVEDAERWPKGDRFAREVLGGMLDVEPDVVRRQGKWHRGHDTRVDVFKKMWRKFDWTRVLTET